MPFIFFWYIFDLEPASQKLHNPTDITDQLFRTGPVFRASLSLYIWPSTWAIFWHTLLNKEDIMKKNRSSPSEPLIPYQHTLLECNFGCRVLIRGTKNQNLYIIQLIIVKISWPSLNLKIYSDIFQYSLSIFVANHCFNCINYLGC